MTIDRNVLSGLQDWYKQNCDGDWEHSYGVEITTLDNPGWRVVIDLVATPLANRPFDTVDQQSTPNEWYRCTVTDGRFEGVGGPQNLQDILSAFLSWARR